MNDISDETVSTDHVVLTSTKDDRQRLKIACTASTYPMCSWWWPWLRRGLRTLGYRHTGTGVHAVDGPGHEYVMYFLKGVP